MCKVENRTKFLASWYFSSNVAQEPVPTSALGSSSGVSNMPPVGNMGPRPPIISKNEIF